MISSAGLQVGKRHPSYLCRSIMVTPLRTLLFLVLVSCLAGLLMLVAREGGWQIGGLTVKYPTWAAFWESQRQGQNVAMEDFFDIYARKAEAEQQADSLAAAQLAFRLKMRHFQYPEDDPALMAPFFEKLERLSREGRVRILHFGDSQIESHRITGYLNSRLQQRYGGSGPGWVPVVEVIPTPMVRQESSEGWLRFTAYGPPRSETHKRYGLLGAFARFTPQWPEDEEMPNAAGDTLSRGGASPAGATADPLSSRSGPAGAAWFGIGPPRKGGARYSRARLACGYFRDTVQVQVWADGQLLESESWSPREDLLLREWAFPSGPPGELRFVFEGRDSPDFYGISLESEKGIFVDNIPLRGSSGTEFAKMDLSVLRRQVGDDPVAMVILQFGGNTLPNMKSQEGVDYYGRVFAAQMRYLKKQFPEALFLIIGPSDMSVKDGLQFTTYPFLPEVRDVMKAAAFAEGALYWDLYEAMGGRNSMPAWVSADPPLAATDYVHFSSAGAQKVAEWLAEAFEEADRQRKNPRQ
jgi:lysophospholipase L1-like esterase